jgi:hypothetical protein
VTTLLAGHPNNLAVVPSKGRTFVSYPYCLDCLLEPPNLILDGYWRPFLGSKVPWQVLDNPRTLRRSRTVSPLHNMLSWHTQRLFGLFVCVLMHTHKYTAVLTEWKILELRNLCHLHQELETSLYMVNITLTHSFLYRSLDSYTAVLRAEKR